MDADNIAGVNPDDLDLTADALRLLADARNESDRLRHDFLGTEHIVFAMTGDDDGPATAALKQLGIDRDQVRRTLGGIVRPGQAEPLAGADRPYTTRTKAAFALAAAAAREFGHSHVGPEHLLVGLMRERKNPGAQVLQHHGLTEEAAYKTIRRLGADSEQSQPISIRFRCATGEPIIAIREDWDNAKIAVVICDMWDTTHCVSAQRRVTEMAGRINEVAARLRQCGALIVHAPAGCMDHYGGTPARERALRAPKVASQVPIDWHDWDASRESPLPPALIDDTPCSCEPGEPCTEGGPPYPWTHQIDSIEISAADAVTDDGAELLGLLEERGIQDVVVMGVHLNRCVLGRPYGIRQLVYWGKRPVLCRDLTDSYHRDPRGHLWGNEQMVAHVERDWCPTLTSDQLIGGESFRFQTMG